MLSFHTTRLYWILELTVVLQAIYIICITLPNQRESAGIHVRFFAGHLNAVSALALRDADET